MGERRGVGEWGEVGACWCERASMNMAETCTVPTLQVCSSSIAVCIGAPTRWYRGCRVPTTPAKTGPMSTPIRHCMSSPVSSRSSSTARSICFERDRIAWHRSYVSSGASPDTNDPAIYASPTVSILKSSQRLSSSSNFEKSLSISAISCIGVIAWLSTVKPTRSSWSTTAIFDSHGRHPGAAAISFAMWRGKRSHRIFSVRWRSF
mmetsp:Transcript_51638/g.117775  ORF Transcript_51638/g.117775 Transcript_51638/m.117775 type:complete len:206 (-) Transcript_51638:294-911(-)